MTSEHVLLIGPPGSGKVKWARGHAGWYTKGRAELTELPSYPELAGTASRIRALAMVDDLKFPAAPFRAPHHSCSVGGLIGTLRRGGWDWCPGELSLAHGGTLLLDDAVEFDQPALYHILTAARSGEVLLAGPKGHLWMPASFRLVAAACPCPCGFLRVQGGPQCLCTTEALALYEQRLEPFKRLCRVLHHQSQGVFE